MAKETLVTPRLRVTAVIEDNGKYFLIEEHMKSFNDELYWLFPGGGVEAGESLEEALLREVAEETNFIVSLVAPLTFFERIIPEEGFHTINFVYLVKKISGEFRKEDKVTDFGWYSREEILNLKMTDINHKIVEELLV